VSSAFPRAEEPARRILFVLPFPPRLDAPHGGRVIAGLIVRLARLNSVAVVCVRRAGEPPTDEAVRAACAQVDEVLAPAPLVPRRWRNRAAQLRKLVGAPPTVVARTAAPGFAERLRQVADAFRPDIVQVEPHEMAQYLPALAGMRVASVLVEHDPGVTAALDFAAAARGPARVLRGLDVLAWRRYARRTTELVDAVVVFTESDRAVVEGYGRAVPVTVIPFGVELPDRAASPRGEDPPSLLFFGGYRHGPNADAALRLQHTIYPAVRARRPEVRLELVGADPTRAMQDALGDGVALRGFVESVAEHLERAAVVVVPLRLGGGMRIKVLEALAAGKAVVASPLAVAGLDVVDGRELLLAESDAEFAQAVTLLLDDEPRRVELAGAARRWAEAHLGWDGLVERYEDLYRSLADADT
jgi:glycosyltransferase involved in cell wall biosynthesis